MKKILKGIFMPLFVAVILAGLSAVIGGVAFANSKVSPLHITGLTCDIAEAHRLIDGGADINAKTDNGSTALHFASLNGCDDLAATLIAIGADVNAENKDGATPLFFAINGSQVDIGVALILFGADLHHFANDGRTPLFQATLLYGENSEMVKRLVAAHKQKQQEQ